VNIWERTESGMDERDKEPRMEQGITGSLDVTLGPLKSTLTLGECFFGTAESLMPSARLLAMSTKIPGTGLDHGLALISGHIVEGLLKAFLSKKGLTEKRLQNEFGHNLSTLWRRSVALGCPASATIPPWAERLSALHDKPFHLRYSKSNALVLPNPQAMIFGLEELLDVVRSAIRGDP